MGQIIVFYRILPESPDVNDEVKKTLEELKPDKIEEDPIGFGLVAFKFTKFLPEESGAEENFTKKLEALPGVKDVEVLQVTRGL